jgi:hypothetical protein
MGNSSGSNGGRGGAFGGASGGTPDAGGKGPMCVANHDCPSGYYCATANNRCAPFPPTHVRHDTGAGAARNTAGPAPRFTGNNGGLPSRHRF